MFNFTANGIINSLDSGYAMENRLQYLQIQVNVAQTALIESQMAHQQVLNRVEESEKLSCEIERKNDEAKEEIQRLRKRIDDEQSQINGITQMIKQKEMQNKIAPQQVVDKKRHKKP